MKYGKLIDGELVLAPNPIVIGDRQIGNPPADVLLAEGYLPVIYSDPPVVEEGFIAVSGWEETAEAIVQTWHAEPEGDISDEEALDIILGGG